MLPGNVRNNITRAETARMTLPRAFTAILFARMNATIVDETVRKTIKVYTESEASRTIEERRSWAWEAWMYPNLSASKLSTYIPSRSRGAASARNLAADSFIPCSTVK